MLLITDRGACPNEIAIEVEGQRPDIRRADGIRGGQERRDVGAGCEIQQIRLNAL
jgi:hypothetical protein